MEIAVHNSESNVDDILNWNILYSLSVDNLSMSYQLVAGMLIIIHYCKNVYQYHNLIVTRWKNIKKQTIWWPLCLYIWHRGEKIISTVLEIQYTVFKFFLIELQVFCSNNFLY